MHIIIIGAGILGASTAYHLARSGVDVTMIDRNDAGQATDAGAGIVCPWLSQRRNQAWYQLAKAGARFYPELIEQLEHEGESETGYAKVGVISVHSDEKKLDQMESRARKRREDAPEIGEITRLSPQETQKQFPLLADGYASLHVSGGARVNGKALRLALIKTAIKYGAVFKQGDAELIYSEGQVNGVKVEGEFLQADQVIVTAGAWAKELFEPLGVEFLIKPQKAQILHLQLADYNNCDEWPVVMSPTSKYLLGFEEGRMVIGSTHENDTGFDTTVTAAGLHEILGMAFELAPRLANSAVLETRVGFRPVSPDFLPVIGEIPGFKGLTAANGLGSSGLTVGPYLGSELAKLIQGLKTEIDLSSYDIKGAIK